VNNKKRSPTPASVEDLESPSSPQKAATFAGDAPHDLAAQRFAQLLELSV